VKALISSFIISSTLAAATFPAVAYAMEINTPKVSVPHINVPHVSTPQANTHVIAPVGKSNISSGSNVVSDTKTKTITGTKSTSVGSASVGDTSKRIELNVVERPITSVNDTNLSSPAIGSPQSAPRPAGGTPFRFNNTDLTGKASVVSVVSSGLQLQGQVDAANNPTNQGTASPTIFYEVGTNPTTNPTTNPSWVVGSTVPSQITAGGSGSGSVVFIAGPSPTGPSQITIAAKQLQNTLDSMNDLSDQSSASLQMTMTNYSTLLQAFSNLEKTTAATAGATAGNIKQ
jgi:hypothetical protein